MRNILIILSIFVCSVSFAQQLWPIGDSCIFTITPTFSEGAGNGYYAKSNSLGQLSWGNPLQYHYSRAATDTVTSLGSPLLVINDSTTTTALLINFPASPYNGQTINISTLYGSTGVTLVSTGNTIAGTITSTSANGTYGWVYVSTLLKWMRKN